MVSVVAVSAFADTFSVTQREQQKMLEEADNWIDDMPDGMQDRLSDAVNHAVEGFYSEINFFRNYNDTIGIGRYKVNVRDIKSTSNPEISLRLYSPNTRNDKKKPLLVYFHGGGWSMGSVNTTERFCRALASEGNVIVASVSYPLAPEKPFPLAINSCKSTMEFILSKSAEWGSDKSLISLGGDGAGGNLALDVYQSLPESLKIRSIVLYYPLINTTGELDQKNKREFGRGYGFDSRLWESFIKAYNGKPSAFRKTFPPILLIGAGRDIVVDQQKSFSSNHREAVKYIEFEGAIHGFITDGHQPTAFNKAVSLTDTFLTK